MPVGNWVFPVGAYDNDPTAFQNPSPSEPGADGQERKRLAHSSVDLRSSASSNFASQRANLTASWH
jgi:hypothetical protein